MTVLQAIFAFCTFCVSDPHLQKQMRDRCTTDLILCTRKEGPGQKNLENCILTQPYRYIAEDLDQTLEKINKDRAARGERSLEQEYEQRKTSPAF